MDVPNPVTLALISVACVKVDPGYLQGCWELEVVLTSIELLIPPALQPLDASKHCARSAEAHAPIVYP